jgi:phosphate transport system substrate-binding protein
MHLRRFLLILLMASLAAEERIIITGSSSVHPLASEMAKRYESLHPGVRIDVQTGGSTRGITDVRAGRAQIGMASRALRGDESDLTAITICLDGIACIVHGENPVRSLNRDQVIAIFTGAVANWSQVGGPDLPIAVVNKAEGRSTLELFLQHFALKPEQIRAAAVIGDNAQGIKTVAASPAAIGYVSIGAAQTDIDAGVPIALVALDGVAASTAAVAAGTWPIARPLNLVVLGAPTTGHAAGFIALARSSAVDDLIAESACVPPPR